MIATSRFQLSRFKGNRITRSGESSEGTSHPLEESREVNATIPSRFLGRPGGAKRPGCYRTAGLIYLADRESSVSRYLGLGMPRNPNKVVRRGGTMVLGQPAVSLVVRLLGSAGYHMGPDPLRETSIYRSATPPGLVHRITATSSPCRP